MYEVFWYWLVAMIEGVVIVKTRIVKYISYKSIEIISGDEIQVRFQYFVIDFN